MPKRSGRLEKRTRLAVPVRISSLREPAAGEQATTENICSLGIRVLLRRARMLNEQLWIKSLDGDLHTFARVVYCQGLPSGQYAVGLQFQEGAANWVRKSLGSGD